MYYCAVERPSGRTLIADTARDLLTMCNGIGKPFSKAALYRALQNDYGSIKEDWDVYRVHTGNTVYVTHP
jgi:hypothetical protein